VMVGMASSILIMSVIWYKTPIAWTWYVLLGTVACVTIGYTVSLFAPQSEVSE